MQESKRYKIRTPYVIDGVEVFGAMENLDAFRWADVICTHLDKTQQAIIFAGSTKRPLIHFIHNDIPYYCIESGMRGTHVVYNSQWIKGSIGYKWPSYVLNPPCNYDYYNVNENPELNEFITLISLNERKGGYRLYEIAKAMPEQKFLGVIGSYDNPGPLKLEQPTIVDLLCSLPNVSVIPNTPEIREVYKRTKILIMPSDYESWGMTATEAMCNGIPVICTPTPGLKENCGDAAVYVGSKMNEYLPGEAAVDIGTTAEWITKIREVNENYITFSQRSRKRAKELQTDLSGIEDFIINARY